VKILHERRGTGERSHSQPNGLKADSLRTFSISGRCEISYCDKVLAAQEVILRLSDLLDLEELLDLEKFPQHFVRTPSLLDQFGLQHLFSSAATGFYSDKLRISCLLVLYDPRPVFILEIQRKRTRFNLDTRISQIGGLAPCHCVILSFVAC